MSQEISNQTIIPYVEECNAQFLVNNHLFGKVMADRNGNVMSLDVVQNFLNLALEKLESRLSISFARKRVKMFPIDPGLIEGKDYEVALPRMNWDIQEAKEYLKVILPHSQVISIERVRAYWRNSLIWNVPLSEVKLRDYKAGFFNIVPQNVVGWVSLGGFLLPPAIAAISSPLSYMVDFWSVDYTYGLKTMDGDLKAWVFYEAAMDILTILGSAQNPGIASKTITYDGLTTATTTTASAIYNIYSSDIDAFRQKQQQIDLDKKKQKMHGMRIFMI